MREFETKSDEVRNTILSLLGSLPSRLDLKESGGSASTRLLEEGLIDSKNLIDIILEVEMRCAVTYNPEHISLEQGLTLGSLVTAFDPISA
jgi:acyl carrier protein